jgi:hypothetical protein
MVYKEIRPGNYEVQHPEKEVEGLVEKVFFHFANILLRWLPHGTNRKKEQVSKYSGTYYEAGVFG